MGTQADKKFLHELYQKYYAGAETIVMPVVSDSGKGRCVVCGYLRKLGQRGHAKGKCKKCRKRA